MKIFIIALCISVNAFADVQTRNGAEVLLVTPWSFMQASLAKYFSGRTIKDQRTYNAIDWQVRDWTPHLSGVTSTLATNAKLTAFSPEALTLSSKRLSFNLIIQKLDINQNIVRVVNGVTLKIHVQAQCGPITMVQNAAQLGAKVTYQILPQQVQTKVNLNKLDWAPNSWVVNPFTCQGPGGFSQSLREELMNDLMDPTQVKPWLEEALSEKLQQEADSSLTELAKPVPVNVNDGVVPLMLVFQTLQSSPAGILTSGKLIWSRNPEETDVFPLLDRSVPAEIERGTVPVVLTPTQGWGGLIETQRRTKGATFAINMLKIKDFLDLLQSPIEEGFAWPDLENYTASSPFNLLLDNPQQYGLQWEPNGSADIFTPATGIVRSSRANRTWTYLHLSGSVNGKLNVSVKRGQLEAKVPISRSTFSATFDAAYVRAFNADTTLDPSVIQAFEQYVNNGFDYSTSLPTMDFGDFGNAVFNGWNGISQNVIALPLLVNQN